MSTSRIDPDLRIRATWGPELHAAYDRFQHFEPAALKVLDFLNYYPLELAEALVNRIFLPVLERRRIECETAQLDAEINAHRTILDRNPEVTLPPRFRDLAPVAARLLVRMRDSSLPQQPEA